MVKFRLLQVWLPIILIVSASPVNTLAQAAQPVAAVLWAELPLAPMPAERVAQTAQQAQETPQNQLPAPADPPPSASAPAGPTSQGAPSVHAPEPSPETVPPPPQTDLQRQRAEEQLRKEEKQRILAGVIPDFNTVNGQEAPPLTAGQKYRLALRSAIDPFSFGAAGFLALIGQAEDSHEGYIHGVQEGYGQGMEGYGKRFGANYADSFSGTFFGNAFFPALLHEDPRYFRLGEGHTTKRRMLYALSTTIRTRTDSGHRTWNYANVLGNIAAGGLSNVYYPEEDRGVALTFENAATVTAEGAIGALGIEFYPDLARRFFHHKRPRGTSATDPQINPQTPMNPAPPHP